MASAGVKVVIVKSVNRIFYCACIYQGLLLIVHREAAAAYRPGDAVDIDANAGEIRIGGRTFQFEPLPEALMEIIEKKGLVNWLKQSAA